MLHICAAESNLGTQQFLTLQVIQLQQSSSNWMSTLSFDSVSTLYLCEIIGGKTTHIATLMGNEGLVVALEKAKNKVRIIKKNARTLNLKIIKAFHKNAVNAVAPGAPEPSAQGKLLVILRYIITS